MFRFRKLSFAACLGVAVLLGGASTARATFTLDFNIPESGIFPGEYTSGQTISYAGGTSALVGALYSNQVQVVGGSTGALLTNSATAPGSSPYTPAALNFTTGAYLGGSNGVFNFSGTGSSISITGYAFNPAGTGPQVNTTTSLLTGSFTGPVTYGPQMGGNQELVGAAVLTIIDPGLAAYLGVPVGASWSGSLTIVTNASGQIVGQAFTDSNDISNGNITISPVPAPAGLVLALVATPCLGIAGWLRKRGMSK
jgi:hypothetical protein